MNINNSNNNDEKYNNRITLHIRPVKKKAFDVDVQKFSGSWCSFVATLENDKE